MNALIVANHASVDISIDPTAEAEKAAMLESSRLIKDVTDEFELDCAVGELRKLKTALSEVESARQRVKAPILDIGRRIDAKSSSFTADLEAASTRIGALITAFHRKQRAAKAEAERIARMEQQRIEDARRAAEAEAQRRAAEEMRAARTASEKVAAEARAVANAERIAREAAQQAKAVASEVARVAPRIEGTAQKTVWKYEVTDIHALAQSSYKLVRMEANASAINDVIRFGLRECPGLRIWSECVLEVRR